MRLIIFYAGFLGFSSLGFSSFLASAQITYLTQIQQHWGKSIVVDTPMSSMSLPHWANKAGLWQLKRRSLNIISHVFLLINRTFILWLLTRGSGRRLRYSGTEWRRTLRHPAHRRPPRVRCPSWSCSLLSLKLHFFLFGLKISFGDTYPLLPASGSAQGHSNRARRRSLSASSSSRVKNITGRLGAWWGLYKGPVPRRCHPIWPNVHLHNFIKGFQNSMITFRPKALETAIYSGERANRLKLRI